MKITVTEIICKRLAVLCLVTLYSLLNVNSAFAVNSLKKSNVLVYTKNGKGFIHDNIPNAVECIKKLGKEHHFNVDVSDNPTIFTEENLKKYTMLVFPSTNNDVFDTDAQRLAFRRYIEAGGGFVGIHSVTGTERNWTWFKQMLGGTFLVHSKDPSFSTKVIDSDHPTVQGLPKVWERTDDECYFSKEIYPGIRVVMAHDVTTLQDKDVENIKKASLPFKDLFPAVWYQKFDGGNVWVTTLGHNKKHYQDLMFIKHILLGLKFIANESKKLDYSKAYADSRDTPVRY